MGFIKREVGLTLNTFPFSILNLMTERSNTVEEVLTLGKQWNDAELQGNVEFLKQKLTDDFICISPSGLLLNKEKWLDRHRIQGIKNKYINWEEVKIRIYGETAIITGEEKLMAKHLDQEIQGTYRITQVFVKQKEKWNIATIHYSLMYNYI